MEVAFIKMRQPSAEYKLRWDKIQTLLQDTAPFPALEDARYSWQNPVRHEDVGGEH
jgi:hypothetical protein